ncbi:hypothetical protein FQJ95_13155 [Xanthomonas vasicola]|nr:hypothetical protein FQJ95_13155 [Xanthomonas vasicola]
MRAMGARAWERPRRRRGPGRGAGVGVRVRREGALAATRDLAAVISRTRHCQSLRLGRHVNADHPIIQSRHPLGSMPMHNACGESARPETPPVRRRCPRRHRQ